MPDAREVLLGTFARWRTALWFRSGVGSASCGMHFPIRAVKPPYHTLARKARYLTVSNSSASETPNARASRNRFLKEGFRRAVSIPPKYIRCIWANSARRSWDSPRSPRSFLMCAASSFTAFCSAVNPPSCKVPPFHRLFPVFPTCQNAAESLGRAGAVYPARFFSRPRSPSHGRSVTPRQPRTSFLGGKGGICDGENVNGFLGRGSAGGPSPATDRASLPVLSPAGRGWRS